FEVRTVRTPFRLVKTLSLSGKHPVLRIQERVTNESGQEVAFTWGHHPALGWPFLDESCRVDVPESRIVTLPEYTPPASRLSDQQSRAWPLADGRDGSVVDLSLIPGPEVAASDMVFLRDLKEGWFAVTNTQRRVGFAMRYPAAIFKYLWYWQVYRGGRNYPWWGATYNIALEPCASLPTLAGAVERNEALVVGAGQSIEAELMAIAYEGLVSVSGVNGEGEVLGQSLCQSITLSIGVSRKGRKDSQRRQRVTASSRLPRFTTCSV